MLKADLTHPGSRIKRDSNDSGVMRTMPAGDFLSLFLRPIGLSPCQGVTGMSNKSDKLSKRRSWSFISAFKGLIYSIPTPSCCAAMAVIAGRKKASVLPAAVDALMSRSVLPARIGLIAKL